MNISPRTLITRLVGLLAVVPLAFLFPAPASAAGGQSTPGVTVIAANPGSPPAGASPDRSDLVIALTAHTEQSAVENPSCRPQDLTLECWGSLFLRVPEMRGMTVTGFEVHRVAVGDITCGDEGGDDGECGDEGGDCGGDEGGCEGGAALAAEAVQAQVNGVAVLQRPGSSNLPRGTKVQVKVTLTDNGPALYVDQAVVQVNEFVPGPVKPLVYRSGTETIEQVQIHGVGAAG